ncbi:MAG: PAS domain-containing protein [Terriglobales bacterium]
MRGHKATDRTRSGETLAHAIKRLRSVFDALSTAIVFLDASGGVLAANRCARRLLGGTGLCVLRRNASLQKAITARARRDLAIISAGRQLRFRILPLDTVLLIDANDISEMRALEADLSCAQQSSERLQWDCEELTCALEMADTAQDEVCRQVEEEKILVEQLFSSNLAFQERNQQLSARIASLEESGRSRR